MYRQPLNKERSEGSTPFIRFAPLLFAYLSRQVVNQQDAEDLLLELFLSAYKETTFEKWPEERQLAWLRRVARNKVIDYYRHQGVICWLPLIQANEMMDERLTPEEQIEWQEKYKWLSQALTRLSPAQQELIQLRYGYELRFPQIAEILQRSEGTIRKMLARTLHQLRRYYEQLEGGQAE